MKDANGSKVVDANLICSGFLKSENECQNAVDMVAPWWRSQCEKCEQTDAWIGFEVNSNVEVSSAYAKGLGLGEGSIPYSWNGGVILQKSDNGGETWTDIKRVLS